MKGLLVLSNNVEDGEALFTLALLRRSGLDVQTVTFQNNKAITTAFGITVQADYLYNEINFNTYGFLVIPGGKYVNQIIEHETNIKHLAKMFNEQDKLVAAICAGPRFLGRAGILDEKNFTCFPGSEKDMPLGHYHPHEKTVTDGNIITARSAGAIYEFAHAITSYVLGEQKAEELYQSIIY
jgi:protein deglycase